MKEKKDIEKTKKRAICQVMKKKRDEIERKQRVKDGKETSKNRKEIK